MLVAIHDSDRTGFHNYALMKISAWLPLRLVRVSDPGKG